MTNRDARKLSLVLAAASMILSFAAIGIAGSAQAQQIPQMLTAIATLALAATAIYGILTWRRPVKAERQYDTACRLHSDVVRLRRAVDDARDPVDSDLVEMCNSFIQSQEVFPIISVASRDIIRATYKSRGDTLREAIELIMENQLTVESVLGDEIAVLTKKLSRIAAELMSALVVCSMNKGEALDPAQDMDDGGDTKKMLLKNSIPSEDSFGGEINLLISEILQMANQYR